MFQRYSVHIGVGLIILGLLLDAPFIPLIPPSIETGLGLRRIFGKDAHLMIQVAPLLILGPLAIIGCGLYLALRRPKPLSEGREKEG